MWCITTNDFGGSEPMYLAWQRPVWDDNGYFWTHEDVFKKITENSIPEHPFLFNSRNEALKCSRSLNIPQKCIVMEFKTEDDYVKQYTVESAGNNTYRVVGYRDGKLEDSRVMLYWETEEYCKALECNGYTRAYDIEVCEKEMLDLEPILSKIRIGEASLQ